MLLLTEYQNKLGYTVTPNGSWRLTQSPTNPVSLIVDGITSSYAVNQIIGTNDPDVIFPSGTYKLNYEVAGACAIASELTIDNYGRVLSIDINTSTINYTYSTTNFDVDLTPYTSYPTVYQPDSVDLVRYDTTYTTQYTGGPMQNNTFSGDIALDRYTIYEIDMSLYPGKYIDEITMYDAVGNSYAYYVGLNNWIPGSGVNIDFPMNSSGVLALLALCSMDWLVSQVFFSGLLPPLGGPGSSYGFTATDRTHYINYLAKLNGVGAGSSLGFFDAYVQGTKLYIKQYKLSIYHAPGFPLPLGTGSGELNYLRVGYETLDMKLDDGTTLTITGQKGGKQGVSSSRDNYGPCNSTVNTYIDLPILGTTLDGLSTTPTLNVTFIPSTCNNYQLTATLTNQTNPTYQWHTDINCNSPIANETNQTYTTSISGPYSVKVADGTCEYCESIYI